MSHAEYIDALGGGTVIADWLTNRTGERVDREAVYKWRVNGVPWRWRSLLIEMAREKRVKAPKDFLPGAAA